MVTTNGAQDEVDVKQAMAKLGIVVNVCTHWAQNKVHEGNYW